MRFIVPAIAALALAVPAVGHAHSTPDPALAAALASASRADDRARDQYRHPAETLEFFGVEPDMKVGEYAPGGGWYSRVLGNYLNEDGRLVGLFFNPAILPFPDDAKERIRAGAAKFPADAAGWTSLPANRFSAMTLDNIPDAEKGTYDRILLVRMLHNMMNWNVADSEIKAMRSLLKDDGMIGIVQHRAKADAPWSYANGSKGYLRQDDVIAFMEMNGFELAGLSEVNANPRDMANHEAGVWYLPPANRDLAEGDAAEKARRDAIGESDRMTLLFRKSS